MCKLVFYKFVIHNDYFEVRNLIFFTAKSLKVRSVYMTFTLVLLQVFHSLLKAHAVEARAVVRQALEILTPAMPGRMEDGNVSLCRSVAYSSRFYHGLSVIILLLYI